MEALKNIVFVLFLVGGLLIAGSYRKFKNGNMRLTNVVTLIVGIIVWAAMAVICWLTHDKWQL